MTWCKLEQRPDRHYLAGQPVHCGDALELRERVWIKPRNPDEDWYTEPGFRGFAVRYELEGRVAVLYIEIHGHTQFRAVYRDGMELRWPE